MENQQSVVLWPDFMILMKAVYLGGVDVREMICDSLLKTSVCISKSTFVSWHIAK